MKLKKKQLEKIWKQIDGCLEAIERLEEHGLKNEFVDFSALVNLKNSVEVEIQNKTRVKQG